MRIKGGTLNKKAHATALRTNYYVFLQNTIVPLRTPGFDIIGNWNMFFRGVAGVIGYCKQYPILPYSLPKTESLFNGQHPEKAFVSKAT